MTVKIFTVKWYNFVGREGLEPPEPVKATDFSDIGITRLCNYHAFPFRYSVYSLYTFMKFYLQFSSALICFILRGANFRRISGVFNLYFYKRLHYHV